MLRYKDPARCAVRMHGVLHVHTKRPKVPVRDPRLMGH
jgi:hypothetical protein